MATLKNTTIDGTLTVNDTMIVNNGLTVKNILYAVNMIASNVQLLTDTFTINNETPLTTTTFKIKNFFSSKTETNADCDCLATIININDSNDVFNIYGTHATNTKYGIVKIDYSDGILNIIT